MIATDLNGAIRSSARLSAYQASALNKALVELKELLGQLPPEMQPPRHKLVEMIGRFTENVGIVYMVCSILEKSLDKTEE